MIIDILGGSYHHPQVSWNAQRTINWYPVLTDDNRGEENKTKMSLHPRPGLTTLVDLGGECVRGLFCARSLTQERLFAVVDNRLYEVIGDSAVSWGTLTGMLTGSKAKVYMELNGNGQLLIQDSAGAYTFNINTNVLARVTDPDYPGGTTLTYSDGYMLISSNTGRVNFSDLNDATSWNGLDVFTPTFKADPVRAVVAYREEIYCFGSETIEIYINDGSSPFSRRGQSSILYGTCAPHSVAVWHGGTFFVGGCRGGEAAVYYLQSDYTPKQISSPNITAMLNTVDLKNCEGYIQYSKDGHINYVLHVPHLKTTYVYDVTIDMWHERQSTYPYQDLGGEYPQDMYRSRMSVNYRGKNIHGDWYSGKLFTEDYNVATDDGLMRKLSRYSSVMQQELKYVSVYSVVIDMNNGKAESTGQGDNPNAIIKWSLDGGNTYGQETIHALGPIGVYDYQLKINNLGTARNWVIAIEITDPVNVVVIQATANATIGSW